MEEHACFADRAACETVALAENVKVAPGGLFRLRFFSPAIASRIVPGQFLMFRFPGCDDPLLGRPLALYDTVLEGERPVGIDIVYMALGKMTRRLAGLLPGAPLEVWGPLGNGFTPLEAKSLVIVAGGIGYTPFRAVVAERLGLRTYGNPPRTAAPVERIVLCNGARSADFLAGIDEFRGLGVEVRICTDDGSAGHHGFVTDLLPAVLAEVPRPVRVLTCGPEAMIRRAAAIARQHGVPCQVSLESPMACGIGICFSCVAKIRDASGGWDYRRTCVEGPVFDAAQIEL